ncbi:hypothetical protein OPT61_g6686 [Boeremia exigua]|uniref:Uncharacterized protein n=1 Tax=Boeremia exigua TaxID=749465 RepID=A0ACC2I529_9PLEO|nr:hypothetical protein OPT61_g6686 [Boeremia exigua]
MDYQAPAPAAGGRGCYNCKISNPRIQPRNIHTTVFLSTTPRFDEAGGILLYSDLARRLWDPTSFTGWNRTEFCNAIDHFIEDERNTN